MFAALDMTTDRAEFRAYLVSSPTLFDLDGDGSLDIIVGNSVGFIYAMDNTGKIKENFPLTMDEIHTQILVGDFQNNGEDSNFSTPWTFSDHMFPFQEIPFWLRLIGEEMWSRSTREEKR